MCIVSFSLQVNTGQKSFSSLLVRDRSGEVQALQVEYISRDEMGNMNDDWTFSSYIPVKDKLNEMRLICTENQPLFQYIVNMTAKLNKCYMYNHKGMAMDFP